jgi:uncharacterized protein YdaT
MAWTTGDFPTEMAGLEPEIRAQAVQIANQLLQEGHQEDTAVAVAISRAKMSVREEKQSPIENDLHVVMHNTGWAIKREQSKENEYLFSDFETRDKALAKAIEIGRYEGVSVVVHAEDGDIVEYIDSHPSA